MEKIINEAWDNRDQISSNSDPSILNAIKETILKVDQGELRVAEKKVANGLFTSGSKKQYY